jgi:hypothetical protein
MYIEHCTFYHSAGKPMRFEAGTANIERSIMRGANDWGLTTLAGVTLNSDHNNWNNNSAFSIDGTLHIGFATYQSATGQDANSINSDPQFIGTPATGDTRINPASPSYVAGLGADVPGVEAEIEAKFAALLNA